MITSHIIIILYIVYSYWNIIKNSKDRRENFNPYNGNIFAYFGFLASIGFIIYLFILFCIFAYNYLP